jgi:hypothetical protein
MTVRFFDFEQESANPYHGTTVHTAADLENVLEDARHRGPKPFVVKLAGDNGFELCAGIGDPGFVQHEPSNGDTPCLIAVRPGAPTDDNSTTPTMTSEAPFPNSSARGRPVPFLGALLCHLTL